MASVVLGGPYNSRSYVIGAYVLYVTKAKYPSFFYQLIPMRTESWKEWLRKICEEEKWNFEDLKREKVLSWYEQGYTGGPKVLLGGLPSLQEYLKDKYGVARDLTAEQVVELIQQSTEHWETLEAEEAKNKGSGGNISIVGAGSNEAISLLLYALMTTKTPIIRSGIKIKLFEPHEDREEQLKENFDRMSTVESNINICIVDELMDVLKNCDLIIFVGDKFRTTGMDIEKFLYLEKVLYGSYGFLCNYNMEEQTKVIFACMENATFNANCFLAEAPNIDSKKIVALTSYLGAELKLYISKIAGFPVEALEQIPVWGMPDTCHLVDEEMGSLIFRVPDRFNPKYPNIKSLARLIEDDTLRAHLYNLWKTQQEKCVAEWRWSKIKENLKIEEMKANVRSGRLDMLNTLAGCYRELEKKFGHVPYWSIWDKSMAAALEGEDYYSPENMYKRFRKGLYQVVQDNQYFENEEKQATKELEDQFKKISEKAEALADYIDPLKIGFVDSGSIRKFLEDEFFTQQMKVEDDDVDELFNETEIPKEVRDMEMLRRDVYNKRNELKKKIRSFWKRHMEEEIARLENELRRKSLASKDEELFEGEWVGEENIIKEEVQSDKESSNNPEPIPEIINKENYKSMSYEEEERLEETISQEIKLPEREVLNRMIKDYFRLKMKLERKVKKDLEKESESCDSYRYEEIDDYEIRELGYITRSMRNLWNFVGICKNAVRKKIGQDPYIAQVYELIRVLKIWFFDPYMKSETVFLGISSDYDVFPFLTDTVMSQPAFCDEEMRWHPLKEAKHLWPKTPFEKIPDNAETDVPFFRTPKEGLPFTIKYVVGTSLECLMHFSIPPASYFETQRKLQEYANQKEFFDLAFTIREADKAQFKDLFRHLGQQVESSEEEDFVVEEATEEAEEVEEVEFETFPEEEFVLEKGEELEEEIIPGELEDEIFEEEEQQVLTPLILEPKEKDKPDFSGEDKTEELVKLGLEEFEMDLEEDHFEFEGDEELKSIDFIDNDDDPLNFFRSYGDDLTEEEFLAMYGKLRDPEKERISNSEKQPKKPKKSLWQYYLEKIGFYKLDIPEMFVAVDEENVNEPDAQHIESINDEKPDNPFVYDETREEISREEQPEEMSEEISEQTWQEKAEKDPTYLMRGIGFIENIERDFSPNNLTEMPFYYRFSPRIKVDIAEKSIHETHTVKVGYPMDRKGRSQMDMVESLNKMDVGKIRGSSFNSEENAGVSKESINLPPKRDQNPPNEDIEPIHCPTYNHKIVSPVPESGILKICIPPEDIKSESSSTESYIPAEDHKSDETSGSNLTDLIKAHKKEDSLLEVFKREQNKQKKILMNELGLFRNEDGSSSESLQEPNDSYGNEERVLQKKVKKDQALVLLEKFNSLGTQPGMNAAHCLAYLTPAYLFLKQYQSTDVKNGKETCKNFKLRSIEGVRDEDAQHKEAWIKGFEKLKRIMELEKISGNSYLHLEPDKEKKGLDEQVAQEKQEKRFADWVGAVIDEHEKIQMSLDGSVLQEQLDNISKLQISEDYDQPLKQNKHHHVWINQMIREIIVIDQIYDLEEVIQSVKSFSQELPGDEILKTVTATSGHGSMRYSIMEKKGNTLKSPDSDSDDVLEPSDEDIKMEEDVNFHWLPPERELIMREIMKTEKEITKDCHDLESYVLKCRENTKLYCLYRGDTPQKWRFLNRQPNENKLRFKYKALIHIMMTMNQLQEDFQKEMEELYEQDIDLTKVLSDSIGEEELKKYGFV